jgi:protein-L-isoaspartate(D-aspartate) O-methyltransferase
VDRRHGEEDAAAAPPPPGTPEGLVRDLRAAGVADPRVLAAFRRVRRENFVPTEARQRAYADAPIPIAHGQVTTQPSLSARMVEALRLGGGERVLEVGTGLGFQTAIVAALCAEVFSVEWFADLAEEARRNLDAAGVGNATVVVGDGTLGLPEHAPYDAAIVSAAAPAVAPPLVAQLAEGGRLVQPIGPSGAETVTAFVKRGARLVEAGVVTPAHFVPLRGRHGLRG